MVVPKRTPPAGPRKNYIREWRKHRRMTLEQLSEKTELTPSAISQMEVGRMGYSRDSLERLATVLGCEPGDLLSHPPGSRSDSIDAMLADMTAEERERIIEAVRILTARR